MTALCGEPLGYPEPRCDLPAGHPPSQVHKSRAFPEHLADAAADLQRMNDELETDRTALYAERAHVFGLWKQVTKLRSIFVAGLAIEAAAFVVIFVAVVNILTP